MVGYLKLKISDIDRFCRDTNTFKADINIGEGHRIMDAKSLLSLVALDFTKESKVEIITDDIKEIEAFTDLLRRYGGENR